MTRLDAYLAGIVTGWLAIPALWLLHDFQHRLD